MGDRGDKVAKAREKLEKFRKNKNKEQKTLATTVASLDRTDPKAAISENTFQPSQNYDAVVVDEQELQKTTNTQSSHQPTHSGSFNDAKTIGGAEVGQTSDLSSYFSSTEPNSTSGGALSSYFQSHPSGETPSGISDAFASLVSTMPSMDSISTNLVSTIQELVVEEPEEQNVAEIVEAGQSIHEAQQPGIYEAQQSNIFEAQQPSTETYEADSSSVPKPAFYIGSEERTMITTTLPLPGQTSEPSMAAPSSSSSLVQDARVAELMYLLEEEKRGREEERGLREAERRRREEERRGRELAEAEIVKLQEVLAGEQKRLEDGVGLEVQRLQAELAASSASIQLVVGERSHFEAALVEARRKTSEAEEGLIGLRDRAERAEEEVVRLQEKLTTEGGVAQVTMELSDKREAEVARLKKEAEVREEEAKEVQAKLSKVTISEAAMKKELDEAKTELEMARVHLVQLRGGGGEGGGEVATLTTELQQARSSLAEALSSREQVVKDRDQLAEQYRSYSRDLASQAERLSEQLRRYQEENAKMVHREAGLVQHVSELEAKMQKFIAGGKNVTEEEICRLKDQLLEREAELRLSKDEATKVQEMFTERSHQVEDTMKRLAVSDNKVLELRARVSGLETQIEMLTATSQTSCSDQAQLLAACESDKVAASRALQQNRNLKERLEELHQAVMSLTNSKAEVVDQLEDAKNTLRAQAGSQGEIQGMREAVKEREALIGNLRNQIRYLEGELGRRPSPSSGENTEPESSTIVSKELELEEAREQIRSLGSHNLELRSQLEVLAARTRDCSESPRGGSGSSSSSSSSEQMIESYDKASLSTTESSDSFLEVEEGEKASAISSESFVELESERANDLEAEEDEGKLTLREQDNIPSTPGIALKQLESRFISAMEKLAELSSDKEQLEHLVERLQEETDTIGDYVIMYQHQRKQQRIKIQEKEQEVAQLAQDRAELQGKLAQLEQLVKRVVEKEEVQEATENMAEEDVKEESQDKEKILELLSEIGSDSNQMVARCENFEPWFWDNCDNKVITV